MIVNILKMWLCGKLAQKVTWQLPPSLKLWVWSQKFMQWNEKTKLSAAPLSLTCAMVGMPTHMYTYTTNRCKTIIKGQNCGFICLNALPGGYFQAILYFEACFSMWNREHSCRQADLGYSITEDFVQMRWAVLRSAEIPLEKTSQTKYL